MERSGVHGKESDKRHGVPEGCLSGICNNLSHRIVPLRLNYYLSLTVRIYNVEALVNTNE